MTLSVFSDEYFMKQAYHEAELALEAGEIPIGAVVDDGRVLKAFGYMVDGGTSSMASLESLTSFA